MSTPKPQGLHTRAIHAAASPDPTTGARVVPIHQSVAFVFRDVDHAASLFNLDEPGYIYSRLTNPTVSALQDRMADLEGGVGAICTASGHSAQLLALFGLMRAGDEFVASNKLYGGSITQFGHTFERFGWKVVFVDPDDPDNVRRACNERTRAVFSESLANPGGVVCDLQGLAEAAHDNGIPLIIDNTLATPVLCNPIEHGADLVVHSTTKFLSGHGNAVGGAIVDSGKFDWYQGHRYPNLTEPNPACHGTVFAEKFGNLAYTVYSIAVSLRDLGPTMSPMNAYLTLTGIETLPLRMRQHCDNALTIAQWLEQHPQVEWVSYAGLPSSPYHKLAQRYCPKGAGSVFTFGVRGGYENGVKVVENVKLFSHLANIGDTRSLIVHPASTTHSQLSDEQKTAASAGPEVIRLSVGIEDADDLVADLNQALDIATGEQTLNVEELVEAYFEAWDAHDPQAIAALFADSGTYEDPHTGGALSGAAISDYAQGTFTAFPDLRLELISQTLTSVGEIAVPWLLFGTHLGPFGEMEATGKSVTLRGCDYIKVADGRLQIVYGTFSPQELMSQLN